MSEKVIIRFGIWEILEDYGIVGRVNEEYDYNISKERLWETTEEYEGVQMSGWLLHLANKKWVSSHNVNDLNTAFLFAWDYYRKHKPTNSVDFSIAQSIHYQKQIIELGESRESKKGIRQVTSDELDFYLKKMSELTLLELK